MYSKLKYILQIIDELVPKISKIVNNIGVAFLVPMLAVITIDVCLRFFFNISVLGSYVYEAVEFMMIILVFLGLSYCEIKKSNIGVDFLVSKLSARIRTIIDLVTYLLSIGFVGILIWRSIIKFFAVKDSGVIAAGIGVPIYPFMAFVAIGFFFLGIALVYNFIHIALNRIK